MKSQLKCITAYGILINSRYDLTHEINLMTKIASHLHSDVIEEIFCDSKACAVYEIKIKNSYKYHADSIAEFISQIIINMDKGYNGLFVTCQSKELAYRDPSWEEYDFA